MKVILVLFAALLAVAQAEDEKFVTFGSAIKLTHIQSGGGHFLSSEGKNMGGGSGQQIVTWIPDKGASSALWWVREGHHDNIVPTGTPIKCGAKIRLTHLETQKNLHTHGIPSALSRAQEVTGFGQDGVGDGGDDWVVECSTQYWKRGQKVRLLHVDTARYLAGSGNVKYTQQNCGGGCPILHHLEAFGRKQRDEYSNFKVDLGVLLSK